MNKLNFAGGEPLLYPDYVSNLVKYAKLELGVTVSIVSNASQVKVWVVRQSSREILNRTMVALTVFVAGSLAT
jgi:radical S-adenosyl methionine domain-containing protein 2